MYQALYRKYRPKTFDDVVGQDYVIKTLKNSVINDKISHAYMFFGPRGVGKTTIAKIFARTVNCENPKNGNSCEICDKCLKSKSKESIDIIEIDAASNNGVDEIRELKSKVNIVPSNLKYKVYIIDEVHMLTPGAFNALLKTLEEPPKHVIFILATTDPQKVSDTIISRCQCYSFKRINIENIVSKLKYICENENIDIDEEVLKQIAISSNGGLRDSISSLDKISSYKQESITIDDYLEMNDLISINEIQNFIEIILSGNIRQFILNINKYNNDGKNLIEIMNQLLFHLKNIIVEYYLNNKNLKYSLEKYQLLINLINEKMFDIKKNSNPKIYIELMILNYMQNNLTKSQQNFEQEDSKIISQEIKLKKSEIISQEIKIEKNKHNLPIISQKPNQKANIKYSNIKQIMNIRLNNALAQADKEEKKTVEIKFKKLNEYVFDQNIGYIVSELLNSKIRVVSKDIIIVSYEYDSVVEQNLKELEKFNNVLMDILKISKKIGIITDITWEKEKQKYIKTTKNNEKYDIIEEPELIEDSNNCENINESFLDCFDDIVEIK